MQRRKTKILATIGPSSDSPEMLRRLFEAGVNACRLNFSHGSHEEHAARVRSIRQIAAELGRPIPIIQDLAGPKVRIDRQTYELVEGAIWLLVPGTGDPGNGRIGLSHEELWKYVGPGQVILLDDGKLEMVVEEVRGTDIVARVVTAGLLKPRKSVNTPGIDNGLDVLSEKDCADLEFGRDQGLDWVAVSFVQNGENMVRVGAFLDQIGWHGVPLIAKVETPLAIDNLEDIVLKSDGIMVARGDLGIECPIESVPLHQKRAVRLAHRHGKLCIVATQMLDSMERNPRPTRAEASDVANAVFDGTQVVMLSGESASGSFPIESVQTMDRILRGAESLSETPVSLPEISSTTLEMVAGVVRLHEHTRAPIIGATCRDLSIVRKVAAFHTGAHVVAACFDEPTWRRAALFYGMNPILLPPTQVATTAIEMCFDLAVRDGVAVPGQRAVFLYPQPFDSLQHNTIRLVEVPEPGLRGD